jgi:APA family basic amino acid/polyamine antiporter
VKVLITLNLHNKPVSIKRLTLMTEQNTETPSALKPSLGLFDAVAVSVGAIIGGGIFVVTGIAAGLAGSALVISMITAALISLLTASSFVQLTTWQPKEGSIYEYSYQLISPFAGFLVGWMWILSNTFAGAAVSLGFAYYLTALIPSLNANYVAAIICLTFTAINYYSIKESAQINNILVTAKLLILTFFIAYGLTFINPTNFQPFKPLDAGVFSGAVFFFFAYGGFARTAVIAEEVKNAKHNVPRAMLIALAISTIVYVLVGITAVGLIGPTRLANSNSPLEEAMKATGNPTASTIIALGGILATASVLLTSILGVSRMTYAMAKRKDLPHALSRLDPKRNTPALSTWIIGSIMTILVLVTDLSRVVAVSSFAMLFFYTLANISALRLRTEKRNWQRILPALGAVSCLTLLGFELIASLQSWIIGTACLLVGAVYYVAKQRLKRQ